MTDPKHEAKNALEAHDAFSLLATERIVRLADASLNVRSETIADAAAPMSEGGRHDYYSNGDYWWPNPDTPDGLPYVRRDGESNPGAFMEHRRILRRMRTHIANLAAGYTVTGNERYAEKAVALLQSFFVDEATRMNPHLLYAQAIPGVCSGRGIGIIDTLHLIDVPMAVRALRSSDALTPAVETGLRRWFADYLEWMNTHPFGLEERDEANNHGVCWHVQAAVFARFAGNEEMLDFCRERYRSVLLPEQMAPDGSFPRELARTKPYAYSIFVLDNMVTLCHTLSDESNDMWAYELPDGRGIRQGLRFLYPYLERKTSWPFAKDVEHFDGWPVAMPFMLLAGRAIGEQAYLDLWARLEAEPGDLEIRRNIAIRQPILWL
ncbi:alginate lyase family protein [Paenibacillus sp. MBLB4367]|uniref:alginate lyase family protein n=1 Tax=Paenibacillus sp. MBLB4367 TaxID=3384767 RepID=UPI00390811DC